MIATDKESARKRSASTHHLLDMDGIRYRISQGDNSFAMRVVLAALMQNSEKYAERVLTQLNEIDFRLPGIDLMFRWLVEQLQENGKPNIPQLYERMAEYVYERWPKDIVADHENLIYSAEEVLPGYLAVIDHIWALDEIDDGLFESAVATLLHFRPAIEKSVKQRGREDI